jgi:hypothetical protein
LYQNLYPGIDARVVAIVRNRSRRLIGRYGIRPADLPDLHQDWISQIVRKDEYGQSAHPDFSRRIAHLVNLLAVDEIRRRSAAIRHYGKEVVSLDAYLGGDTSTIGETVSEEDYLDLTGGNYQCPIDRLTARQDMGEFIRQLPPELRRLAELVQRHPLERVPALTGISRATVFRRMQALRRMAQRFFQER